MKTFFSLLLTLNFLLPFGDEGSCFAQDVIVFDAEPENLGPKVNTEYSEISPTISPDGKTLFVTR
ncbi:MAG: hypothetical protein CVT95_10490, partial [Bacteroidetes bacterium HGW-Bacteroidetes-12]